MANLQQHIKDKAGTRTPFTVPEGYFDSFTQNFIKNLPTHESEQCDIPHSSSFILYLKRFALAACALVAIFSVSTYLVDLNSSSANAATMSQYSMSEDDYIDLVADYAMIDNSDIYAYLSEE